MRRTYQQGPALRQAPAPDAKFAYSSDVIDEQQLAQQEAERERRREHQLDQERLHTERLNQARSLVETFERDGSQCLGITTNRTKALIGSVGAIARLAVTGGSAALAILLSPALWTPAALVLALHLWFGLKPRGVLAAKGKYFALHAGIRLAQGAKTDLHVVLYSGTLLSEGKRWRGCCKIAAQGMPRFAADGLSPDDFSRIRAFCRRHDLRFKDSRYEGTVSHG